MSGNALVPLTLSDVRPEKETEFPPIWPVPYSEIRAEQEQLVTITRDRIAEVTDPDLHDLIMLSAVQIGWLQRSATWSAQHALGAKAKGLTISGGANMTFIAEGTGDAEPALVPGNEMRPQSLAAARRLARTSKLNPGLGKLIGAVLRPDVLAVSHNQLLNVFAQSSERSIRFSHGSEILRSSRARQTAAYSRDRVAAALRFFETCLSSASALPQEVVDRLGAIWKASAEAVLIAADKDLADLNGRFDCPETLWSGTCGNYSTRALTIAAKRHGAKTVGFDHGGSAVMVEDAAFLEVFEFSLRCEFVSMTKMAASFLTRTNGARETLKTDPPAFLWADGEPTFIRASALSNRNSAGKPNILFVISVYGGLRQRHPPLLPDPVALSIQCQVIELVRDWGATVRVRPHPETQLFGKPHPLSGLATLDERPFLEALEDYDLVIFDYPQTTSLWETVCSDRSVVLIDSGIARFTSLAAPIVERRLHRVTVDWHDGNMPVVPSDVFGDTLSTAHNGAADPSEFQQLLARD